MTKKEAQEMLIGTKVYVNGKSEEIQKKLFKLGFKWDDGQTKETIVNYVNQPFLFINGNMFLGYSSDMSYFIYHKYKEISVEKILSIKEEHNFQPFDKVLVRDDIGENWRAGRFSHLENGEYSYPFYIVNSAYKFCIPYENNEHLIGTNLLPK